MSKAEILAELPKLQPEDRRQLFERICELQDQDLLQGVGPTEQEKRPLDDELAEFERDRDRGLPWREVVRNVRSSGHP